MRLVHRQAHKVFAVDDLADRSDPGLKRDGVRSNHVTRAVDIIDDHLGFLELVAVARVSQSHDRRPVEASEIFEARHVDVALLGPETGRAVR